MRPASSSDRINIAASARRLDVDNRISLRFYYRIADNILRQADIFRLEKNVIDLYIMLLRFSSLVSETIPRHREYGSSPQNKKVYLKKKLLASVEELEKLKPAVQQRINELNHHHTYQVNGWSNNHQSDASQWPPVKNGTMPSYDLTKAVRPIAQASSFAGPRTQQLSLSRPVEEQFSRISLSFPRPKEETLSRHSIFGPNGLYGNWKPSSSDKRVQYPINIDLTPVEIPRLQHPVASSLIVEKESSISQLGSLEPSIGNGLPHKSDSRTSEPLNSSAELTVIQSDESRNRKTVEPVAMISFDTQDIPTHTDIVRQPSPPSVLAEVQDLTPVTSPQVMEPDCKMDISAPDLRSESPLQLHINASSSVIQSILNVVNVFPLILKFSLVFCKFQHIMSTNMMESFMKLAKINTDKDLETCGILAGSLCQATNEEEIFEVQDKRSLFPLGWIHTHPTQSCFMSSIDVHTHYSYQIMLPESVAIVMAPRDSSRQVYPQFRKHGIFRLTTPGGMSVIRQCQQRGFHAHDPPSDGGPIYKACTDVYMNPTLKFDVIDLR
ncbi:unnamed protein product [Linum tenue]|uniref:MPN domain-containing protein n=1 Tax=Linum tenue TaxID=586396 RepID=A0AAV0IVX4_9ROSI|nr:unnamed protein product [Linum tenue]